MVKSAGVAFACSISLMALAIANPKPIDIPAGRLLPALELLAKQTSIEIFYQAEQLRPYKTNGLRGDYEPKDAVRLLIKGMPLELHMDASGAMAIAPISSNATSGVAPSTATAEAGVGVAGLNEIVVTATRRDERLQDVPVSIAVFSQEKLDAKGIRSIDDLASVTPGVTVQRNGVGAAGDYNDEITDINIRGIDSTAGTPTVAVYVDDTPIQSRHIGFGTFNAYPALFDLDRVEVLRGPQGTLFGASAEGGSVRFISPEPGLSSYSGYLRTELATTQDGDPSYEEGVAVGGPIIDDTLGFRLSASFRRDGGYVDRVNYLTGDVVDPRANWQNTSTVRAAFNWKVTEGLTIEPSFYRQEVYLNDTGAYWEDLSNPSRDIFKNGNAGPDSSRDPLYLASVRVKWDLGPAELFSNTAYYSRKQHAWVDYTQFFGAIYLGNPFPTTPYPTGTVYVADHQDNFYQEIRVASKDASAPLIWNAGVYFAHLDENNIQFEHDPYLNAQYLAANGVPFCTAAVPCPNGVVYYQPYDKVVDRQIAAFGEVSYLITSTLKVTAGARVSHDEFRGQSLSGGPDGAGATLIEDHAGKENPVTPKAVLNWQPNGDSLYYISAAKGFRVGGTNADYGVVPSCVPGLLSLGLKPGSDGQLHSQTTFGSDSLWSYEIGSKNTLLERRLQINTSLFIIDWKNIQQEVYLPSCGDSFTSNLGKARSTGGDVEALFRATDALTLDLTMARTQAKYTATVCLPGLVSTPGGCAPSATSAAVGSPIVTDGDALVGAPWTFVASAEYLWPIVGLGHPYSRIDYEYSTRQRGLLPGQDLNNGNADPTIPGLPIVSTLGLRAGFRWGGADVSLFAQNLLNTHPLLFSSRDTTPVDPLYFGHTDRPRTIGVTATYRF
jgi:iron complex outermembrane recepter protein